MPREPPRHRRIVAKPPFALPGRRQSPPRESASNSIWQFGQPDSLVPRLSAALGPKPLGTEDRKPARFFWPGSAPSPNGARPAWERVPARRDSASRQIFTTKAQRHQERLRSSSPQISQKDADFEIQIGEIGVICGSLSPFLVSFRHWGGFKATCLDREKSAAVALYAVNPSSSATKGQNDQFGRATHRPKGEGTCPRRTETCARAGALAYRAVRCPARVSKG